MNKAITYISTLASLAFFHVGEALAATQVHHGAEHVEPLHIEEHIAHHAESGSAGLPQFNPDSYASQAFWILLVFTALYAFFSKSILPALSTTIERRRDKIQGDLDVAKDMKQEAERVYKAYEESLNESRATAQEILSTSEETLKAKKDKIIAEIRDRSVDELAKAEISLSKSKQEALKDMDNIAAELASLAAQKIVGISTDAKTAQDAVANINKKAA